MVSLPLFATPLKMLREWMLTYALDVSTYALYHIYPYVSPNNLVMKND